MGKLSDIFTLARWLGPWADETKSPNNVRVSEISEQLGPEAGELSMLVYEPTDRPIEGAFLLAPGLHFLGAPHPRFQRFASILAASGNLVMSPHVPDYASMQIKPGAHEVFFTAFDRLLQDERTPAGIKPGVFGISFGSWLVFKLAADSERASRVGAAVIFGGYGDFCTAAEFALSGHVNGEFLAKRDLRNTPAVFMHIVDDLGVSDEAGTLLTEGWMQFMHATWENDAMSSLEACRQAARSIAEELPAQQRELFEIGCGVRSGGEELLEKALKTLDFSHLDVRGEFVQIKCPVYLMHGRDDDVIPYTEVDVIASALPEHVECEQFLTGLYGHSKSDTQASRSGVLGLIDELATMVRMLRVLEMAGKNPVV